MVMSGWVRPLRVVPRAVMGPTGMCAIIYNVCMFCKLLVSTDSNSTQ